MALHIPFCSGPPVERSPKIVASQQEVLVGVLYYQAYSSTKQLYQKPLAYQVPASQFPTTRQEPSTSSRNLASSIVNCQVCGLVGSYNNWGTPVGRPGSEEKTGEKKCRFLGFFLIKYMKNWQRGEIQRMAVLETMPTNCHSCQFSGRLKMETSMDSFNGLVDP